MSQIIETKACAHCGLSFDITDKDKEFYDKISPTFNGTKYSIPNPTWCPDCRQQRRLTRRNERKLYHRPCSKTGKTIISNFAPEKTYTVYETKERFADTRDAREYGRERDPSQTFFTQFDVLLHTVPQIGLLTMGSENCDFNNYGGYNKNCYLCFDYGRAEDCAYLARSYNCKSSFDLSSCANCEQSSNLLDCDACTKCNFCQQCDQCYACNRCYACVGSSSCFLCTNLSNAQYHIFNKPYTKEEYENKLKELSQLSKEELQQQYNQLLQETIHKYANVLNCEQVQGDNLVRCKNCREVYSAKDTEDCSYVYDPMMVEHVHDDNFSGNHCQYNIETIWCEGSTNLKYCYSCWSGSHSLFYCHFCIACSHCFGCAGLRNKEYCILNKQYTKEEYEQLVPQIIEKMKADGERGEFFPSRISPFTYNESLAQETFPLTKEVAISQWFARRDEDYAINVPAGMETIEARDLSRMQYDEHILQRAIICTISGKPYRIIKSELAYYQANALALPTQHPDIRNLQRISQRNPRKLRDRPCDKCGVTMKSTYAPERQERVYCEVCYNKEIYW